MTSLELFNTTGVLAHLEIAFRLVLAAALAGLLGWDREEKERPAGLRTYMLIALAAAVFTVLTFDIYDTVRQSQAEANADPIRIIEAVTAGVAFLAAGVIIQGRNTVRGLTTGAGMWMAGALGVAAGTGNYTLAIVAALLGFVVLRLAHFVQSLGIRSQGPAALPAIIVEGEEDGDTGLRP